MRWGKNDGIKRKREKNVHEQPYEERMLGAKEKEERDAASKFS